MWWNGGTVHAYVNINIYVELKIILEKKKKIGIRYNIDNIQMLWIRDVSYSTVT